MPNLIHVTHEAVYKVGGIGTVLEGLINARAYRDHAGRTVLVCPLFYPENPQRLGPGGVIEYSSLDNIYDSPYADAFIQVEREWGVRLVYGQKPVEDTPTSRRTMCEVLLVDLRGINLHRVNHLKGTLWDHYGIQSHRHEHIWEYEQYVQLAGPAAAALDAMRLASAELPAVVFAHEFMGVPTALTLQSWYGSRYRSLFYGHEVAVMRRLVENLPGHDVMFYNVLETALRGDLYVDQVFGPQSDYFKYELVNATRFCDGLLSVGHHVVQEMQFMGPAFQTADITLVFNGIPSRRTTTPEWLDSRRHIEAYLDTLLGWKPTWIFTHVTRLVRSKAMWRDLDVLTALDRRLEEAGEKAVLIVLSTELPRRAGEDIRYMEREWDWPLAHREQPPDLTPGEAEYYQFAQSFNARARNIRVLFLNQFGFDQSTCGLRVPADAELLDLRRATDVEFGLSLYEPFGISPLEPLTFGAICVVSTSCGCVGFVKQSAVRGSPNVLMADYIAAGPRGATIKDAMETGAAELRLAEQHVAAEIAEELFRRLPRSVEQRAALLESGQELARRMSWDAVAERMVFPAIRKALGRRRVVRMV